MTRTAPGMSAEAGVAWNRTASTANGGGRFVGRASPTGGPGSASRSAAIDACVSISGVPLCATPAFLGPSPDLRSP